MTLIDILEDYVGLSRREILAKIAGAPKRYKVYQIPKRSGGHRTIAQPARDVKLLQAAVIETVLAKLPVHGAATAYQPGRSIRKNAQEHVASDVILKLDFQDFFPSIRVGDWTRYCRALDPDISLRLGLATDEDLYVSSKLLFWGRGSSDPKCLSIGAPSSPILSNILMFRFDTDIAIIAGQAGVSYTRYADDITLSADRGEPLVAVETAIRRFIRRHRSPALTLNEAKRGLYTAGQKRMVTGLVLTPEHKVSLGRHRKRAILSQVHTYTLGLLPPAAIAHVQGLVAFARDVEPTFYQTLVRKYGSAVISGLTRYRLPERIQAPPPPNDLDL